MGFRGAMPNLAAVTDQFVVARNPDPDSSLPYLLRLPIDGGLFFKTRESWPRANRSYCHPVDEWPEGAEIVEEVKVSLCRRRGCDNRKFAEEWIYRFLGAALAELGE